MTKNKTINRAMYQILFMGLFVYLCEFVMDSPLEQLIFATVTIVSWLSGKFYGKVELLDEMEEDTKRFLREEGLDEEV